MRLELVSIATDTETLDGLFYEPEGEPVGAALLLHGNCGNFYSGICRFLPPVLARLGLASLAFNRRGHDILGLLNSRATCGGAYQRTAEMIADNRYAAGFLRERGFANPIVIGHSNGGMLAVRHVADHPDTPALVLLSAHMGGPELVPTISKAGMLAADRLDEVSAEARRLVAEGRGRDLMMLPGWWYVCSAATFVDYLDGVPAILPLAPKISCPTLFVRGDKEPPHLYPAEDFAAAMGGPCDVHILPGSDHFYTGVEDACSEVVLNWLTRNGVAHPSV